MCKTCMFQTCKSFYVYTVCLCPACFYFPPSYSVIKWCKMEDDNVAISLCLIIIASAALRIPTGGGRGDGPVHGYIGEDSLEHTML